ncbi:hypothetical protein GCM10011415_22090 [Salipiger pallidus]|uniref:Histidine kinase/HSP90-like ATPase domain-containing protein n=1 Tax=Salipiger pallidus TaxID=1775170 RepID=A0A8J3EGH7_9RHOB|nr:ATP-binding protein [Salipiger pallidus]GGG73380.1 hypothetical protein GCM10011415_22090 [Salipiger pallidus]
MPQPVTEQTMLDMSLESTPVAVRGALARVVETLCCMGWDEEPRGTVQLVIAEALNNIVEHAYGAGCPGQISLRLRATAELADIVMTDHGMALPGATLPGAAPARLDVPRYDLPEGGFGWQLIRGLSDRLSYRHSNGVNHLEIRICRCSGK